jgi:hypothetical protein
LKLQDAYPKFAHLIQGEYDALNPTPLLKEASGPLVTWSNRTELESKGLEFKQGASDKRELLFITL